MLSRAVKMNRLYAVDDMGERLIYAPQLYKAEGETARLLRMIQRKAERIHVNDTASLVSAWEEHHHMRLAPAQREAVAASLLHGVLVLTGGPGTGKTTVIRSIIDILGAQGMEILLAAPTGRAAKRLAEATGYPAATVHRMLEAQGREDGEMRFARDAETQLEADIIIVDEVSMMDIVLMQHLLVAVLPGAHVIFVGDVDQLPAVGPGSVLKDILRSGVIPSVRLTEIFRQNNTGTIVLNAHAINAGRVPSFTEADFSFIPAVSNEDAAGQIVALCRCSLPCGVKPAAWICSIEASSPPSIPARRTLWKQRDFVLAIRSCRRGTTIRKMCSTGILGSLSELIQSIWMCSSLMIWRYPMRGMNLAHSRLPMQ